MITSKNTSINKHKVPSVFTKLSKMLYRFPEITTTFDVGGGKWDTATEYMKSYGIKNLVYDPHNRTAQHNETVLDILLQTPKKEVLGIVSNVLNVIQNPTYRKMILKLSEKLSCITLITVYEGNKSGIGKITKADCWQENRKIIDYIPEIKQVFDWLDYHDRIFFASNDRLLLLYYGFVV